MHIRKRVRTRRDRSYFNASPFGNSRDGNISYHFSDVYNGPDQSGVCASYKPVGSRV